MPKLLAALPLAVLLASVAPPAHAEPRLEVRAPSQEEPAVVMRQRMLRYERDEGLLYESCTKKSRLWIGVRAQMRYTTRPGTPKSIEDLESDTPDDFFLNRGRIKGGGYVGTKDVEFYSEYDAPSDRLLDLRGTFKVAPGFHLRLGQWKSDYNRERIDSSGKQQFAERSISTYWFTIDRQMGAVISGRVGKGRRWDSSYWVGVLAGTGRGNLPEADEGLCMLRYQWNFTRRVLGFSQSDVKRRATPAGSIAVAIAGGDTTFTRYASGGGGQLPGFTGGLRGRYRLTQFLFETAYQHAGFSWQQEFHVKDVVDKAGLGESRTLWGGYAQAGYFFCGLVRWVPRPLELAARVALVDPDAAGASDKQFEGSLAANWFFRGHRNKLTVDASYLRFDDPAGGFAEDLRFRFQWELSL